MKNEIRKINKAKRSEMTKKDVELKSRAAAEIFLSSEIYKSAAQIMLYMPIGNEMNTCDIIKAAFDDGKKVIFPVTDAKSGEITPYYADKDTVFEKGAFSIYEPCSAKTASVSENDVIVVPGVAFDKSGVRVGFGKGCYDKFLKKFPAVRVGLCYVFQLCDQILADEHDISMDYLVTENGLIDCSVKTA